MMFLVYTNFQHLALSTLEINFESYVLLKHLSDATYKKT